jgi:hypothetical protein
VRPYDTTPEQRTTIKMGMKTIRRTICLSREQALEYHRYQITSRRGTGCPDRTTGHLWGGGEKFSPEGIRSTYSTTSHLGTSQSTIEALVNRLILEALVKGRNLYRRRG